MDDIALLREYAGNGSEQAFATLVARHIDRVYSVALRHTGNPHQAEEITQATFVILAQKSKQLGNGVILEGWLYQTARLTALTHLRSEIRRTRREQEASMQHVRDENEVWPQIAPLLDAALAGLNETDRTAVVLRFFYGKSMTEIGTALGSTEDTARMRVNRAVEKLRRYFSKHGVTSTAAVVADAISAGSLQTAPATLMNATLAVALAKGATASASTLTLVKGALKVMAWTKTKTAAIAGIVVLLAAGTATVVVKKATALPPPSPPRTTPATESIKGQIFSPSELVDAGNTTPEAGLETRFWARANGDYDGVLAATEPRVQHVTKSWMGSKATFHARSKNEFSAVKGLQLVARKDLAADRVELEYQLTYTEAKTPPFAKIVQMVRINGAWLSSDTRASDAGWDASSQPEPQP